MVVIGCRSGDGGGDSEGALVAEVAEVVVAMDGERERQ